MLTRNLGSSGMKISELAFGTGSLLARGTAEEEELAAQSIREALDLGFTTFDTADFYADGRAESMLGRALAGERRESLEICTKVYGVIGPGGPNDQGLSRKHIMEAIDGSLKRLNTDYVDLYQAHRYDHHTPLEETMVAFADLVHRGKVHYIGVSEWRAEELRAAHALAKELRISLVSNQPQYNLLWRVIDDEVVPTSRELGIGQIVWSPLAQGVLTGKYLPGAPVLPGSRASDGIGGGTIRSWSEDHDLLARIQQLGAVAQELDLTTAQLSLAWVLQNDNVSAAIVAASRPGQVKENIAASGVTIPDDVMRRIDEIIGPDHIERDASLTPTIPGRNQNFPGVKRA